LAQTRYLQKPGFSQKTRYGLKPKKPGFFFRAFRSNQISHRNPVSQRKRDRAETGFLGWDSWATPDISPNPVSG